MAPRSFEPRFWTKSTWYQILYGVWANQVSVAVGLAFSFSSIMHYELTKDPRVNEGVWIGNILPLTAPIGCLISGFLIDKIGRRVVLRLCTLPMALGWFTVCGPENMALHIFGRVAKAIGVGMALPIPRIYTSEISLPRARLINGAVATMCISLGIFVMSLLHSFMSWTAAGVVCGIYTISVSMSNHFLPETPHSLLLKGRDKEYIKRNIRKFRSNHYVQKAIVERKHLLLFREKLHIKRLTFRKQLKKIIRSGHAHLHFLVIMIYAIAGQMFGALETVFWTVDIIKAGHYKGPPDTANCYIAFVRILAAVLGAAIYVYFKRKQVAVGSTIGVACSYLALGITLSNSDKKSYLNLFLYMMVIVSSTIGFYTLPFLMLVESAPLQIRGLLGGVGMAIWSLSLGFSNVCFHSLDEFMGYTRATLLFGLMMLACAMFFYMCLPETYGMSLPEIEEHYYYSGVVEESTAINRALDLLDGGYKPTKSAFSKNRNAMTLSLASVGQSDTRVRFEDIPTIIPASEESLTNVLEELDLTPHEEKEVIELKKESEELE